MVRSLVHRVFTLCLVYVSNTKQGTFLDIFVLPSKNLTNEESQLLFYGGQMSGILFIVSIPETKQYAA